MFLILGMFPEFSPKTRPISPRLSKTGTNTTFSCTCQIVFIDISGSVLLVAKILEGLTKIKDLLPGLACSTEFGFRRRQRDDARTEALPRDRLDVHHEDVADVQAASMSVAGLICVRPSPQLI